MRGYNGAPVDRPGPAGPVRTRRRFARWIPLIVVAAMALLILKDRVPGVDDWILRQLQPAHWQALQACRQAGLAAAREPAWARVIDGGRLHETAAGFYVSGITIGEKGEGGGEARFRFQCYVDPGGRVVGSSRE